MPAYLIERDSKSRIPMIGWLVDYFRVPVRTDLETPPGTDPNFYQMLERSLTITLRIGAPLATMTTFFAEQEFLSFPEGRIAFFTLEVFLWIPALVRGIPFNIRVIAPLLILYAFGLTEVASFGYSAESFLFFIVFIVGATLLGGRRGRLAALLASLATFAVFGWQIGQGNFMPLAIRSSSIPPSPLTVQVFLSMLSSFTASAIGLHIAIALVVDNLNRVGLLHAQTANQLKRERDLLEQRVAERTVELRQSQQRYQEVVENANDIIYQTDAPGRLTYCNNFATQILGYPKSDLLGRNYVELILPAYRTEARNFYRRQLTTQTPNTYFEIPVITKDGKEVWLAQNVQLLTESGRVIGFQSVARDITGLKQAEIKLRAYARHLTLLNDLTRVALETPDLQSMLQTLADRFREMFNADGCGITLWDESERRIILAAGSGFLHDFYQKVRLEPDEATMTQSVLQIGHAIIAEDVSHTPHLSPRLAALFFNSSVLVLPLIAGEWKIGAVILTFNQPHHFTSDEIEHGEQAAAQIALAVAKGQLLKTEHEQRELAESLREVSLALSASLDFDTLLDQILKQIARVVPYDAANVAMVERFTNQDGAEKQRIQIACAHGYEKFGEAFARAIDAMMLEVETVANLRVMAESGKPLIIPDTAAYPDWVKVEDSAYLRSWAGAPIVSRGQVVAFFSLDKIEPGFYQPQHIEYLAAFAGQAAIAIENSRLYGEARREVVERQRSEEKLFHEYNRLSVQHAVSHILWEASTVEVAIPQVLQAISENLQWDIGHYWQIDHTQEKLRCTYFWATPDMETADLESFSRQLRLKPGEGLEGQIWIDKTACWVENLAEGSESFINPSLAIQHGLTFALAFPIVKENEMLGIISMFSRLSRTKDESLLQTFAAIGQQLGQFLVRQQNEAQLRLQDAALAATANAIVITDRSGSILWANPAFNRLTGYPLQEVIGRNPKFMKSGKHDQAFYEELWVTILLGQTWEGEIVNRRKDGLLYTEKQSITPVRDSSGKIISFIAIKEDITERKEAEETLRSQSIRQKTMYEVIRAISEEHVPETVAQTAANTIKSLTGWHSVGIVGAGEAHYPILAITRTPLSAEGQNIPVGQGIIGRAFVTGSPQCVADVIADPDYIVGYDGMRSELAVPVWRGEKIIAVLDIESEELNAFTPDDVFLAKGLADALGLALDNAHLFLEAVRNSWRMTTFNQMTRVTLEKNNFGEQMQALVDQMGNLFNADGCVLTLWDDVEQRTIRTAVYGSFRESYLADAPTHHSTPGEPTLTAHVLKTGRSQVIEDTYNTPYISPRIAQQFHRGSMLGLPLFAGSQKLGAVLITFGRRYRFTPEEITLGEQAAGQIALAVAKARLDLNVQHELAERKRVQADLEIQTQALARSNADLEQFAYSASHDLQEPLRMIVSYTQLLDKGYHNHLDAEADDYLHYIVDGSKRMQSMIKGLLSYARLGRQGETLTPTDCEAALRGALSNLQMALQDSGGVVTHDTLPSVNGNQILLTQVFQNLIGNALKFCASDRPPRVHVSAARVVRENADGNSLRSSQDLPASLWQFAVRDNGIGIPSGQLQRLFILFRRLHTQTEYPGTGIGLALSKRIIEWHGGRIWVESQPGQGTTFYFTLEGLYAFD